MEGAEYQIPKQPDVRGISRIKNLFDQVPGNFGDVAERNISGVFLPQIKPFLENLRLGDPREQMIRDEWSAARVLSLYFPMWEDLKVKPTINSYELGKLGLDKARIARFLILEAAFPKGAELNADKIRLTLDKNQLEGLEEIIKEAIPGYRNFDQQQLSNLLDEIGIKENKTGGSYVGVFDQQSFQQLIRKIIFTHSA
jgi:hypothetical protein